jgi:hypothetical protein
MTRPSWLGRAARNRHRHDIEQASRRWRGGRRGDSGRTRRKILIFTQALALSAALERCAQERETRDALARATKSEEEIEEAEAAAAAASSSDSDSSSSSGESYSGSSESSDDEDYRAMWCSKAS